MILMVAYWISKRNTYNTPHWSPLAGDQASGVTDLNRRYPTDVVLDLKGNLLSPEITFDIDMSGFPSSLAPIADLIRSEISNDEQELNRQVFSLIILRKFSEPGSFNVGGASVSSSVSELLSNQLSYWMTQVDDNLEIDVDLGDLDEDAFNTFQLRLSYTFLDGRLRVTRDGAFGSEQQQSDAASAIGDWTVEYLLTPDGKFRVKMYNKTNYELANVGFSQSYTTAGFSLLHTQNFDRLRELWKNERNQREKDPPKKPDDGVIRNKDAVLPETPALEND